MYATMFVALFGLLCTNCSSRDAIIARVDGEPIRASLFQNVAKIMKENYDPMLIRSKSHGEPFRRTVLERLIQEKLLVAEALRQDITADAAEVNQFLKRQGISPEHARELLEERSIDYAIWLDEQRAQVIIQKFQQGSNRAAFDAWYEKRRRESFVEIYDDALQTVPLE